MDTHDLHRIAGVFAAIREVAADAKPHYDMLSDALFWSDEFPREWCDEIHLIRPLLRHRTCLIITEESPFEDWWIAGKALFPGWIGFRPERSSSSVDLQTVYSAGRQIALESIERHLS
jgi:hypothetical protein